MAVMEKVCAITMSVVYPKAWVMKAISVQTPTSLTVTPGVTLACTAGRPSSTLLQSPLTHVSSRPRLVRFVDLTEQRPRMKRRCLFKASLVLMQMSASIKDRMKMMKMSINVSSGSVRKRKSSSWWRRMSCQYRMMMQGMSNSRTRACSRIWSITTLEVASLNTTACLALSV